MADDIALEGDGEEFPKPGDDDDNLLPENASEQNSSDDEADDDQPNELSNSHYLNKLSEIEYTKMCGYNCSEIIYQFKFKFRSSSIFKKIEVVFRFQKC